VVTLDFFLNTVQYGERETTTKSSRISFLCDFIDDVLHYNASAWDDSKPFLSASELSSRWMMASMMKLLRPETSRQNNKNENSNQRKIENENGSPPHETKIEAERSSHRDTAGVGTLTHARTKTTKLARPLGISLKC
jgi:hypothetical protein